MANIKECKLDYEDLANYLVEYRGDFKNQIDKVSYACGDIINNTIGVVATSQKYLDQLLKDVPSITLIDNRRIYVVQDISPASVDNVNIIKINPYLNLTGDGVLIGMIDTGIDYLNEEFILEDGTSKIVEIWDQTIVDGKNPEVFIGETYSSEQINNAIKANRNKEDPYKIVPTKDEIGHGTEIAGIIGARGVNKEFEAVAPGCKFVIVKLRESPAFKKTLKENGVPDTPVYSDAEILAAIEFLKNFALNTKKPMVIHIGVGTTEAAHDGNNLISKYITAIGSLRGIVTVAGVGNEGAAEGHTSGLLKAVGDTAKIELLIPKEMKYLSFNIWVFKPNRMALSVSSPTGETSEFIKVKTKKLQRINFIFVNTEMYVEYNAPDFFTGHEIINVTFRNIKPGIWTLQLLGKYIIDGRYHIWLPPQKTLPEGTKFLQSDQNNTLTVPSTARKVVTVSYTSGYENTIVGSSGSGFNTNNLINPDVATTGTNILTTKVGGGVTTISGSSAASAIITGACALLLQWGVVEKNDTTMYSIKVRSYLIYGAIRNNPVYKYPNKEIGYGIFDLLNTFNIISRSFRVDTNVSKKFSEYYVNDLFVRIPKENMEDFK